MCDMGTIFLSTFLSAPSQRPEPATVRKLLNGTTEYAETGDVHAEPLEIQALVCRPKLQYPRARAKDILAAAVAQT